jgi:hypothetical protein
MIGLYIHIRNASALLQKGFHPNMTGEGLVFFKKKMWEHFATGKNMK